MKIANILIVLLVGLGFTLGTQASEWTTYDNNQVASTDTKSDYYFDEGNFEDH